MECGLVHFAADGIRRAGEADAGWCRLRGQCSELFRSRLFRPASGCQTIVGVEEQFYIVFPTLLVLLWRYGAVRSSLALIGIVSFALNIGLVRDHPSFTFYLTLTRFWEFIAGGLLACSHLYGRTLGLPMPSGLSALRCRDFSAAIGMLLILAGISFTSEESFPGWWALPPVLGAFFIIGAGPQAWLNRAMLANPKLVFVGLISYPLYLWHWPILVIARTAIRNEHGNE